VTPPSEHRPDPRRRPEPKAGRRGYRAVPDDPWWNELSDRAFLALLAAGALLLVLAAVVR
jgi:hypothetical protein